MKGSFAIILFMTLCVAFITYLSIKQNLGHAWFLEPYTLGKFIFLVTRLLNRTLVMPGSSDHLPWVN